MPNYSPKRDAQTGARRLHSANFPVFFPVSREFGAETGSQETASSANNFKGLGQKILAENESGKHRCANSGRRVNALCGLLVKD